MSKQQYLNDQGASWHPHLMFFVSGDAAKSWGADLPGSPIMAADDPEERTTIFMVWVGNWSDFACSADGALTPRQSLTRAARIWHAIARGLVSMGAIGLKPTVEGETSDLP
jgi:hypothetical protein